MDTWGPPHQQPSDPTGHDRKALIGGGCVLAALVSPVLYHLLLLAGVFYGARRLNRRYRLWPRLRVFLAGGTARPEIAEPAVARSAVYLGVDKAGHARWSREGRAVLVLGPSQSGKTTGVIIPTLRAYPGAGRVHVNQTGRAAGDDGRALRGWAVVAV